MADDIAALIHHLGLEQPDVMGYSLGGGVAIFVASKYPELSAGPLSLRHIRRDAIPPRCAPAGAGRRRRGVPEGHADVPGLREGRPAAGGLPALLDKIGEAMAQPFDFSDVVRGIQVPTLIAAADADMAPPSHYVEIFALLDGGLRDGGWMGEGRPKGGHALAILPGLTHYTIGARRSSRPPRSTSSTLPGSALSGVAVDGAALLGTGSAVSMTQQRLSPGSKLASSSSGAKESAKLLSSAWFI